MNNDLKLVVLQSMKELGESVQSELQKLNNTKKELIVPIQEPRFSNGEGKIVIGESLRDKDVYVLADVGNHSITYDMHGYKNHYSPDDHFRDIERSIVAMCNNPRKISVVMPLLYSSRQHRKKDRESLDCAIALKELNEFFNVKNIVTIDVHDPEITNAIPLGGFDNIYSTGLILNEFLKNELDNIDINNLIIISPDTGATERASFYSSVFTSPLGIFYKQRDYTTVENGRNKIISHDYAGPNVEGKDIIVVDDMVSSGDSLIDVAEQLNKMKAKNVYFISTFSLFVNGIDKFKEAYEKGMLKKLYTTNYTYIKPEYRSEEWLNIVDGSDLLARIINTLHQNNSLAPLIDEKGEVARVIKELRKTN